MTGPPAGARVRVVLPAYNEAAAIGALLDRTDAAMRAADRDYAVVVVDDGSGDDTARIVESRIGTLPVVLERHPVNAGLGRTLRDGLEHALAGAAPDDVVVTLDADGTHAPEAIDALVRVVEQGRDVAIASRFRPGARVAGVPASRRALSLAARVVLSAIFPTAGVRDFTCGFRAYRAGVLARAAARHGGHLVDETGFSCMLDVLLKLRREGARFAEVPIDLSYDVKAGASKMKVTRTVLGTLWLVARRRLGRW